MKYLYLLTLMLVFSCQTEPKVEQEKPASENIKTSSTIPEVDTSLYETFRIQEPDTSYLMKKYFMVHLKTGPDRSHDEDKAAEIQKGHRAHLSKLAEDQKICIAGPFDAPDSDIRGIVIYSVPTFEIADSLANADPAVKAGRLAVDVFPFWAAVGSQLF